MTKQLCICMLVAALAFSAQGREIYVSSSVQLLRFDSTNPGNPTYIGNSGLNDMFGGIDFGPNNVLYGYTMVDTGQLYKVSTTTGVATPIGGGGLIGGDVMTDLAWNPVAGKMYGIGQISADSPTHLYEVNLTTGRATPLGVIDIPKPSTNFGLAADATGVMYMEDGNPNGIYRLNGLAATFLGYEGFDFGVFDGMTIDWSGDGTFYHGAYNLGTSHSELWTVDPQTGVGTFVGTLGDGHMFLGDLAILPVPEPATTLLLSVAALLLRRRG